MMKNRSVVFAGLLTFVALSSTLAQDLKFDTTTPLYPVGAASHSYTNIGTPSVNVDINISGDGTISNPINGASTGLSSPSIDFTTPNETRNFTFIFGDPVVGLEFSIIALQYKIDFTNPQSYYQDKVTIIAFDEFGNSVMPVIPAGTGYIVNGNEILANTPTPSVDVNKVRFTTKVKTVIIVFGNGPMAGSDPRPQGFTIGHMDWTGVVLPVEFAYFRAIPIGSVVQLSWETTSERNADYFTVEHSLDVTTFTPIGRVRATGDAIRSQSYSFADDRSHRTTNYYRLQQVDKDGTKRFSKIIAVRYDNYLPAVTAYPNPSDGQLIGLQINEIDPATLQVTDVNGCKIGFQVREETTGHVTLKPVVALKPGIYFVGAAGSKASRFVVK